MMMHGLANFKLKKKVDKYVIHETSRKMIWAEFVTCLEAATIPHTI
jgi:hypothetical protein